MIKFKHFYHIEGSSPEKIDILQEAEDFVNSNGIDPIEISHAHTVHPVRSLSIFISYVQVDKKQEEAIKEAVKKAKPKKATKKAKK